MRKDNRPSQNRSWLPWSAPLAQLKVTTMWVWSPAGWAISSQHAGFYHGFLRSSVGHQWEMGHFTAIYGHEDGERDVLNYGTMGLGANPAASLAWDGHPRLAEILVQVSTSNIEGFWLWETPEDSALKPWRSKWRFPEMGVPPVIIRIKMGISLVNQPAIGYPHGHGNRQMETSAGRSVSAIRR